MLHRTVLIIGFTWPEPETTAAGNHMLQLLEFFQRYAFQVIFASTAKETEHALQLEALGVPKKGIQVNDPDFDNFVKTLQPNIVLFDRFLTEEQFGWRVAEHVPSALRILDTEDLHSLRQIREKLSKEQSPFTNKEWLNSGLAKREMASIYRCDLTLVVSTYEMELLTKEVGIPKQLLLHVPLLLSKIAPKEREEWPSFDQRNDFICIGNGKHSPNIDALIWLKTDIWPKIRRELPDAKLLVYGAYLPKQVEDMHRVEEGFLIEGWVKEVRKVMMDARVNLAPLRFGAGIKGKLILGMQTGTPSVTTNIGAEGMHDDLPWNGKIADSSEDFAKAAVDMYCNKKDWELAQGRGQAIIHACYNKEVISQRFLDRIQELLDGLESHRSQNFIGTMLIHHTMASTKYLSKYIVEKNKRA
ncbi:glycosyltransferase [Pareuzebyella sediminis]|uniref:glycosyltransferase n=1 Tax=Pareuzebyella sediminis TaxID=2607998 RepID=UPI0011EE2187|nr:glycosyltransferase [Pareuzebyella sediminis]